MTALTLAWHPRPKMDPTIVGPNFDATKLVTVIAVAPASLGEKKYQHNQVSAQPTWIIPHNLGSPPAIVVTDVSGNVVEANVTHLDANTAQVDFTVAVSGFAYLYA